MPDSPDDRVSAGRSHSEQAGILIVGKILASLSEAVVPLVLVRLIDKATFGNLVALLIIYSTIALVVTAGFPNLVVYYLSDRSRGERRALAYKIAWMMTGLGALAGVILLLISTLSLGAPLSWDALPDFLQFESGIRLEYLALLALFPLADIPFRMAPNLLVVENHAVGSAAIGIFRAIGRSIAIVAPVALGYGLWAVMGSLVAFGVVSGGVLIAILLWLYAGAETQASPASIRDILRLAVPLGFTEIVTNLNNRVDRYFIMILFTAVALAEYEAGAWTIPLVPSIAYGIGTAYMPLFTKLFRRGKAAEAIAVWQETIRKTSLMVLPITAAFLVAAEEAILLLFTADYLAAVTIFRIYMLRSLGRITAFGNMIVAAGKPEYIFRTQAINFVGNIIFSAALVYSLGFEGPAWGSLLAFVLMMVTYCWYIGKAAGVPFRNVFPLVDYGKVLGTTALACSGAVLFKLTADLSTAAMLGVEFVLVIGGFAVLGSLFGLITREDWRFIGRQLRIRR